MPDARLHVAPAPFAATERLERELGCSPAVAQALVRRGHADPAAARAWLAGAERHDPASFGGLAPAAEVVLRHVRAGSRIVLHGDYDVDGVCSTAVLVSALRELGADVGWHLPSRAEDGYGLSLATVDRLAARGTALLIAVDCGITAVAEVAAARGAGIDVVVCDHHSPRADGALPDAAIVHPRVGGYPCAELCATAVAHALVGALLRAAGRDPAAADDQLDLVALATVADCVPLVGENRRLVREGLRALAGTRRPGLRALMAVAHCDPGALDARACGFRLAPRINAAGRLARADAALELLLCEDAGRAAQIADELDRANAERRHVETRILFEAEAQLAATPGAAAYVLAGEGWHPGVIGIVAARIAERHHRPCVAIALDGEQGTGSGRSIPAFDLLGGLDAAAAHLLRHGGHRAAAGLTIAAGSVDAFRAAFVAHAERVLAPEDLVPVERVDAVVSGDELGLALAEELAALAPFGQGNPEVSLLLPAARLTDERPMGEGKHVRFTVQAGGARARAVAFGLGRLPDGAADGAFDATFGLELNEWAGAVEPRLVLRRLIPCAPGAIGLAGEPEDPFAAALAEAAHDPATPHTPTTPPPPPSSGQFAADSAVKCPLDALVEGSGGLDALVEGSGASDAPAGGNAHAGARPRDRRGIGIAGTLAALVASGEPVLVVCADARARRRALEGRLGGFAVCSYAALEREPAIARPYAHVVALDPPAEPRHEALLQGGGQGRRTHLAWGEPELAFAVHVHERDLDLRGPLRAVYAAARDRGADGLAELPPLLAGRCLRVLAELGLVVVDAGQLAVPAPAARVELDRSPSLAAYERRLEEGRRWLRRATPRAA